VLDRVGIPATVMGKVSTGDRGIIDAIESGRVGLVLNTPFGSRTRGDGYEIRSAAVSNGVPCITTLAGILAAIHGIEALERGDLSVVSLQEYQRALQERIEQAGGAA
jgi:carbamoyl-phosphate synthase large subunit